jgi:hypothetical protein
MSFSQDSLSIVDPTKTGETQDATRQARPARRMAGWSLSTPKRLNRLLAPTLTHFRHSTTMRVMRRRRSGSDSPLSLPTSRPASSFDTPVQPVSFGSAEQTGNMSRVTSPRA